MAENNGSSGSIKLPFMAMLAGVTVICLGAGFGLARLMGNQVAADAPAAEQEKPSDPAAPLVYHDLFANNELAVNIDDRRMNRMVIAPITLAFKPEHSSKGIDRVTTEKAILKHLLATYFAGCTLDDLRGSENRNRIAREILDTFNKQLWPDSKPLIHEVLLGDLKVQ